MGGGISEGRGIPADVGGGGGRVGGGISEGRGISADVGVGVGGWGVVSVREERYQQMWGWGWEGDNSLSMKPINAGITAYPDTHYTR